jgi:2-polyprenyl-6-methoxyphenol hydroxylase-like FAD-dependent oxidoreductase
MTEDRVTGPGRASTVGDGETFGADLVVGADGARSTVRATVDPAHPIVHYKPARLVTGRVALAGDAAHAASPMVGGGFRQGLYDVLALAQALRPVGSPDEVPDALTRYQDARLAAAIRHVTRSEQETAAYLAHATRRTAR